jgi:hypothetical protein
MACENLYASLSYNISNDDLSNEEKQYLTENISKLDNEKKELLYTLILHDYIKSNPNTKVMFPYKSKQIDTDRIEIKVDALPNTLKRVLHKFVTFAILEQNNKK